MRVLLVEDDTASAKSIEMMLKTEGYVCDSTDLGQDGLEIGKLYDYDLIILDLMLPDMDGFDVLRRLRMANVQTPIMILSGLAEPENKIKGLDIGADDYLTKPFHIEELMARVNALMRRSGGHARPRIQLGPVTVDLSSQRVYLNGEEIELTTFEYKVLNYLVMHPGEVVTKTDLSEHIYEEDADRDSNVIEVFIGRLRRKIDPDGTLNPIETLRGRGYRLVLEPVQ